MLRASSAGKNSVSCQAVAKAEVFKGVVKCSTNLNSDPVDMLTDCLKLGISTGVYGLTLTNLLNDVLLGQPELRLAPVGLRVIDPDYINIMDHRTSAYDFCRSAGKTHLRRGKKESFGSRCKRVQVGWMYLCGTGSTTPWRSLYRSIRRTCR